MVLHGSDFVIIDKSDLIQMHRLVFNSLHRCGIDTKIIPEQVNLITNLCELDDKLKDMINSLTKEESDL